MHKIAAIVVNYNAGIWLERCVKAILAADSPVELYVVDNASTDDSFQRIKSLSKAHTNLHLVENTDNLGFAKANNSVLNTATADYYVLINPDCIIGESTLGQVAGQMDEDMQIGLAGVSILNEDGSLQKTSKRRFPTPENTVIRMLGLSRFFKGTHFADFNYGDEPAPNRQGVKRKKYVEAVSGAFMMISRSALSKVGGLDEGYFMHCEDLDWCKRLALQGFKVAIFEDIEVMHVKGKSSSTRPYHVSWYLHAGMLRFYKKFYRKRYGVLVSSLVYLGVWVRFAASCIKILAAKALTR